MKQPFSVLIPDGESDFALFVAHCLAEFPNVRIYALCEKIWTPIRFSRYCRSTIYLQSSPDDETKLKALADIIAKNKIDVLLPTETKGIAFAIAHREALSTFVSIPPLPDEKSFEIANNKWLLSRFLEENGIPVPRTILVTQDHLEKGLHDLEYPVLMKPVDERGGRGVKRFETPADVQSYLKTQDMEKIQGRFLVQSFLPGSMVGFNVLSLQGKILAATIQREMIRSPEGEFGPSAAIEFIKDDTFLEVCRKLLSAMIWSGYANVDTVFDTRDKKMNVVDFNARFWGSLRGSLVAGVNFPYLACLAALHVPFPPPDYELAHYYHLRMALKEGLLRPNHKRSKPGLSVQQSGLRFLLLDPLAEIVKSFQ